MENRLYERLKELTNYHSEILSLLNKSTVLCGGLVLQVMTNKRWDTDIDIYTTDTNMTKLPFGDWTGTRSDKQGYMVIPGILGVYTGKINDVSIDIIHMTSLEEVFRGFDFDFCKVWFDGKEFHAAEPESVRTQTCTISNDPVRLRKSNERIPKYESRGFTIIPFGTPSGVDNPTK